MIPARLSVAITDAIPHPAASAQAQAPAAPPPVETPAPSPPLPDEAGPPLAHAPTPPASRRRGLLGWLRRPAEYARAYLTASLEHQLHQQAGRAVDLAGAAMRLETVLARTDDLARDRAHEQALRMDEVSGQVATLSADLVALARRLDQMQQAGEAAEAEQRRVRAAEASVQEARRLIAADQIALARRGAEAAEHAVARVDQVLGILGPRFDELEIKVRPVVEIDAESVAVRMADGYVMLPRSEPLFVTAVANATSGGLEPGVRRILRALLAPGDACADVGANVGLLTLAMAYAVGAEGRVWAFEPEARVRAQLSRTLHMNGLEQVILSGAAVGARAGRLTFHQSPIIGHSSLYPLPDEEQAAERPAEVEVVRLDDVVTPGVALAAVKIDVEGAELDVLEGMSRVIADSPDLAVVAEFGPSHLRRVGIAPDAWFAAFAAHGLAPRLIGEPSGATSPVTAGDLLGTASANLVFVRPGGAAEGRLPR